MTTQTSTWTTLLETCPNCGGAFGPVIGIQKYPGQELKLANCLKCDSTRAVAKRVVREGQDG